MTLLAYCTGFIFLCTVLLAVATSVTIKNYWLLRELSGTPRPGRHDDAATTGPVLTQRYDSERSRRLR